ncbi:unnamed protein product [Nippostrongylus brasiliensis]|uniref:RRM domain-containing protein n=1 Tax=Nippostrongylus brasiliensis TaxID=27835 RepID=A0A0N4YVN2_NIPBR|nr:unnamed protein product [Nippostrongylus brasiliensis]
MPVQRKPHGTSQSRPHPPHGSHHPPRNYKTLYDKDLGAKETIRRYNGHIPGHPKYDVKMPLSDPRNHYIQYRTIPPADLNVPSFTVDRNTLFYPKVEVALFKLNDNVNKAFLQQLVTKVGPPVDLEVFYHPVTKKHMGMAMIVFNTFSESRKFVNEYNDRSIMGGQVTCCHDPYFSRPCHSSLGNAFVSEPAHDDDMDVGSPAASSAKPSPNFVEKHADPCTPVSEFPSTSR